MDNPLEVFCRKWYTYIKFVQTIREKKKRIERSSDGSLWWNQPTQVQILDLARVLTFSWIYSKNSDDVRSVGDTFVVTLSISRCDISVSERCS